MALVFILESDPQRLLSLATLLLRREHEVMIFRCVETLLSNLMERPRAIVCSSDLLDADMWEVGCIVQRLCPSACVLVTAGEREDGSSPQLASLRRADRRQPTGCTPGELVQVLECRLEAGPAAGQQLH